VLVGVLEVVVELEDMIPFLCEGVYRTVLIYGRLE